MTQDLQGDFFVIDSGAIGAVEIGEHKIIVIHLNPQVNPADTFIIELDRIAFFTPDRDRKRDVFVDLATVCTVEDSKGDLGHSFCLVD